MFSRRRAARIRTLAVILVALFILTTTAFAKLLDRVPPGNAHIRNVTTQVIKRDSSENVRVTARTLYNKTIASHAIGNSLERCIAIANKRTLPKNAEMCTVIYRFPLGQIVATGIRFSSVVYTFAITGGTGYYRNIGGEVEGTILGLSPQRESLTFNIVAF